MNILEGYSHTQGDLSSLMSEKIHYACGWNVMQGWLNVDGFDESYPHGHVDPDRARRIFRTDLTKKHPFASGSFVFGYAEDFLEHLDQSDALIFLSEAYRTLRRGGVLRLSFPGLEGVLRRHLRTSDYEGAATCQHEAYTMWWHKHFFSAEELRVVAAHIGFQHFEVVTYGQSSHPELQNIETRPEQIDLNLICELTR
jgi:predicted SAM-dependent methyltransferase